MTTALGPRTETVLAPDPRTRKQRRSDRHRRRLETFIAALVLLVAFAVTVVLLGLQWLGSQSEASLAPLATSHIFVSEVQPS
jgi:type VI protein secretion system component VasF